jgi:hypothetical protein
MGRSKFSDNLSLVILPFGGNIGDGSLCDEISLILRRRRFFYFLFRLNTYICILVTAWSW